MTRLTRIGVASASILAAVALAGVGWGATSVTGGVWIDAPLDGAVFDIDSGVIRVVGHVSGAGGFDRARLDVDGNQVAAESFTSAPGELTTVRLDWDPTLGTHVVALWARGVTGDWAEPAVATITVEGEDPVQTTNPPTTTAPTTTDPTTTVACLLEPPDPVSPADGSITPLSANTLSWVYTGCRPALEFQIEVSSTPTFLEVFASGSVPGTEWLTPPMSCDTYWWRVRATTFDNFGDWSTAWTYTVSHRGC